MAAEGAREDSKQESLKRQVGEALAKRVEDGQVIGIGTGSTVDAAIDAIATRVRSEGIRIAAVPTSFDSAVRCASAGLWVLDPRTVARLDWAFDGADEVQSETLICIKGKGAAHTNEKIQAAKAGMFVVIVDESKLVSELGQKCAVPIEVLPQSVDVATRELLRLGATEVVLRPASGGKHGAVVTENGNLVLDGRFSPITPDLENRIKSVVGVVESGLFVRNRPNEVLVARAGGNIDVLRGPEPALP